jgi:DNA-binding response OmpR family regulator
MKTVYTLIGPQGVGKSTWLRDNWKHGQIQGPVHVISPDTTKVEAAKSFGIKYDDIFLKPKNEEMVDARLGNIITVNTKLHYEKVFSAKTLANCLSNKELYEAKQSSKNVVIDKTNMTIKSRKYSFSNFPDCIHVAILFVVDNMKQLLENVKQRSEALNDKFIPDHVVKNTFHTFEEPTSEEGFDAIRKIPPFWERISL